MPANYWLMLLITVAGMLLSIITRTLTIPGAITGGCIAILVFLGNGYNGVIMMAVFFVLGSLATLWRIHDKQKLGLAENQKSKRTAAQVIANGGIAGIAGLFAWLYPEQKPLFSIMTASAFASATADTLSSELGNVYGRKFYNILTFQKDKRGLDGVISLEGTLFGIAGSVVIAAIYAIGLEAYINAVWVTLAGTAGNIVDSILGASLERKHYLNNNAVNFLNTTVAALIAGLLYLSG